MAFDLTINLGHILTVLVLGVFGFLVRSTIGSFERRMTAVEIDIKALNAVVISAARFEERLAAMRGELTSFVNTQIQSHTEWRQWVRNRFEKAEADREQRRAYVDRKIAELERAVVRSTKE